MSGKYRANFRSPGGILAVAMWLLVGGIFAYQAWSPRYWHHRPYISDDGICRAAAAYALKRDFHALGLFVDQSVDDFIDQNPLFCKNPSARRRWETESARDLTDGFDRPSFLYFFGLEPTPVYVDYKGAWERKREPKRLGRLLLVDRSGRVRDFSL